MDKSKKILAEISAGDLFDKISILEIKCEKIKDSESLKQVKKEYLILINIKDSIKKIDSIDTLYNEIKEVNLELWSIEDKIRICEKNKDFGNKFIELARNVYLNNDKRAKIKSKINEIYGSNIKEIKQYANY